jgi:hypothetical protein
VGNPSGRVSMCGLLQPCSRQREQGRRSPHTPGTPGSAADSARDGSARGWLIAAGRHMAGSSGRRSACSSHRVRRSPRGRRRLPVPVRHRAARAQLRLHARQLAPAPRDRPCGSPRADRTGRRTGPCARAYERRPAARPTPRCAAPGGPPGTPPAPPPASRWDATRTCRSGASPHTVRTPPTNPDPYRRHQRDEGKQRRFPPRLKTTVPSART